MTVNPDMFGTKGCTCVRSQRPTRRWILRADCQHHGDDIMLKRQRELLLAKARADVDALGDEEWGPNPFDMAPEKDAWKTPPAHYDTAIQPWAIWEAFQLDPWRANAVKYLLRAGRKEGNTVLDDLVKAKNCIEYLIEKESGG